MNLSQRRATNNSIFGRFAMTTSFSRHLFWLGALAVLVFGGATTSAFAGPFSGLAGSWSGSGHISLSDGTKERIRCRAHYAVGSDGTMLQQSLRCASDSYNFDLRSDVESHGGRITGNWNENTRQIGGTLSGHARQGHIEVSVQNPNFSARLTLVSHGHHQSVTIRTLGGGQFTGASITLARRG
jgi:hypothetical protein